MEIENIDNDDNDNNKVNLSKSVNIKNEISLKNTNNNNTNNLLNNSSPNIPHEVVVSQTIYQLKVILIGNSSVGKTSLVNRFMGHEFQENYQCTINADFKIKLISLDQTTSAELTVWDTCGQERYKSITRTYFKDAHGIILVYDVSNMDSFNSLSSWLKEIKNNSNLEPDIVLVGNKIDLEDRKVTKEKGEKFAEKNGLIYTETSSKEGFNIDSPFEKLAQAFINKVKDNPNYNNNNDNNLKYLGKRNYTFEKKREKEIKCC